MEDSFNFNSLNHQADLVAEWTQAEHAKDASAPQSPQHSGNVTVYQTTGPDAHKGPILTPDLNTPVLNPRSCVTCRRRKVRCDKQMPCSNCRRVAIPCVFPAPGRAPRRPKDSNAPVKNSSQREAELVKRLRKLEGIVEELSEQIEVDAPGKAPSHADSADMGHFNVHPHPRPLSASTAQRHASGGGVDEPSPSTPSSRNTGSPASQAPESSRKKEPPRQYGRLLQTGQKSSQRYVSSGFWAKLTDELDAIREETMKLTDEDSDDSGVEETPDASPATMIHDHHSFILGYRSADVDLQQCHPLPQQIPLLWSVFQENVDPLVKVIHKPTMELVLREARKSSASLSPANEALVFSIYYAAVTSMTSDEVRSHLNADREALLSQYQFSVEQALARTKFLENPEFVSMQALTIFLTTTKRVVNSRLVWSLIGLLVRLAHGIGLHRDGTQFDLSPFEIESRRRLWWAILMLDARSSEEMGTELLIDDHEFDTEMPRNYNDADFGPDTVTMPEPREGLSDTSVASIRHEICRLVRRYFASSINGSAACNMAGDTIEEREAALLEVYHRIEEKFLNQIANKDDPLFVIAAILARVILGKLCLVFYQPLLFSVSNSDLSSEVRERILVSAIEVIEYSQNLTVDPRCRQFSWLFQTYTNWHAIAYTLLETGRRPWTALIERGWVAVSTITAMQLDVGAMLPLRQLYARARKHRAAEIARLRADPEEAHRLDCEERQNPALKRFGNLPGMGDNMEQMRQKWRQRVRPDGDAPASFRPPHRSKTDSFQPTAPSGPQSLPQHQSPHQLIRPVSRSESMPMDLATTAMDFVDDLMAQPTSGITMSAFWNLSDAPADAANTTGVSAVDIVSPSFPGQQLDGNLMGQQTMPLQGQVSGANDVAPLTWPDAMGAMNAKTDDIDLDMLGDDFNWHEWSQSMRGSDMGNTMSYGPW